MFFLIFMLKQMPNKLKIFHICLSSLRPSTGVTSPRAKGLAKTNRCAISDTVCFCLSLGSPKLPRSFEIWPIMQLRKRMTASKKVYHQIWSSKNNSRQAWGSNHWINTFFVNIYALIFWHQRIQTSNQQNMKKNEKKTSSLVPWSRF